MWDISYIYLYICIYHREKIYIYLYIYIYRERERERENGVLFCHIEQNIVVCRKMDGTGDHHFKWNKLDSLQVFSHMCNLDFKKVLK
jgi:hypothetical protein